MEKEFTGKTQETIIALIDQRLDYIQEKVNDIDRKVTGEFVTKKELQSSCELIDEKMKLTDEKIKPITNIVYGLVGIVLMAAVYAIMRLIFK